MLYLSKKHDPLKNAALIERYSRHKPEIKSAIDETGVMLKKLTQHPIKLQRPEPRPSLSSFFEKIVSALARFSIAASSNAELSTYKTMVDHQGGVFPEWKPKLDEEYLELLKQTTREVNVLDFGAIGDGKTDNTMAFKKALSNGRVKIHIPEGVFIVKGIQLPSWTCLVGGGKGKTIIKLSDEAPKGRRLVSNSNFLRGNHHILVEGLSLDWNVERLGDARKTSTWGNYSSCLTYANVAYGWVKDVEAINAGLHGFDASASYYDYSGDGNRARGASQYIWFDQLNAYGFGDDGITTHHSKNVFISNCHLSYPSGKAHDKGYANSNGIEIDDGSRNVWLVNNSTTRCFGGIEIKAHHNSSAANNIQIIGHLSVNDNRSYNFRHIGHHKRTDPNSRTAYYIRATNIISIAPVFSDLYEGSTPRGMVVSAYVYVAVNHFTLIGDPDYEYRHNPVIAVQYKARNISMNHISIRGFHTASSDIRIFGGEQHADNVCLKNIGIENSAPIAIDIGKNVKHVSLQSLKAISTNGKHAVKAEKVPDGFTDIKINGYTAPVLIKGEDVIYF